MERSRAKRSSTKKLPGTRVALRLSKARLAEMIEQATVDAYGDSELTTGWFTMFEEHVELPFQTQVLGSAASVTRIDLRDDKQIVAICSRGRIRQAVPLIDLPLPSPPPRGAEWIEAYRRWRGRGSTT